MENKNTNKFKNWSIGFLSVIVILLVVIIGMVFYENNTLVLRNIEMAKQIREYGTEGENRELLIELLRTRYTDEDINNKYAEYNNLKEERYNQTTTLEDIKFLIELLDKSMKNKDYEYDYLRKINKQTQQLLFANDYENKMTQLANDIIDGNKLLDDYRGYVAYHENKKVN